MDPGLIGWLLIPLALFAIWWLSDVPEVLSAAAVAAPILQLLLT